MFTPRVKWQGMEDPELGKIFTCLDHNSPPLQFFERTDAPDSEYKQRALNSEKRCS